VVDERHGYEAGSRRREHNHCDLPPPTGSRETRMAPMAATRCDTRGRVAGCVRSGPRPDDAFTARRHRRPRWCRCSPPPRSRPSRSSSVLPSDGRFTVRRAAPGGSAGGVDVQWLGRVPPTGIPRLGRVGQRRQRPIARFKR
jgi:hypothetical protein